MIEKGTIKSKLKKILKMGKFKNGRKEKVTNKNNFLPTEVLG